MQQVSAQTCDGGRQLSDDQELTTGHDVADQSYDVDVIEST